MNDDPITDPVEIEDALIDTTDAMGTPEPAPAAPVYNAVIEEIDGTHTDVWIDDLSPRQRTFQYGGQEFYHVQDAADGRWIYRGRP